MVTVVVEGHGRRVLEADGFIVVRMIRASELTMFNGGGRLGGRFANTGDITPRFTEINYSVLRAEVEQPHSEISMECICIPARSSATIIKTSNYRI